MILALSTVAAANILSVLGGVAELAGLGLVALEIHSDRKQAAELFAPPEVSPPPVREFPRPPHRSQFENVLAPPLGPSLSQQQFGRAVASGFEGVAKQVVNNTKAAIEHTDNVAFSLQNSNRGHILRVREDLENVLAGNVRRRVIGAVAIGVGIALATAGSILGNI